MADVQIAVIDPEDTQLALAAPAEAVVNVAVPGVQGPIGLTGSVTIAQAGTAATPGIRFESDPNTGIYSPGADQLAVSTGGTGRLFVDANGTIRTGNAVSTGVGATTGECFAKIGEQRTGDGPSYVAVFGQQSTSSFNFTRFGGANGVAEITNQGAGNINIATLGAGALLCTTNSAERLRITSAGLVGIGTTNPAANLAIRSNRAVTTNAFTVGTANGASFENDVVFAFDGSTQFIGNFQNFPLAFTTNNTERVRIDTSGRLLVGTSSARGVASANASFLEVETNTSALGISCVRNTNDGAGGLVCLGKSRGVAIGSVTVVQDSDILGEIRFAGADGTDLETMGASIAAQVDGTPGANDMPGRLVFSTTADGAATPTERMRIKSTGTINFSSVAVYAANDAAITGGLAAGDVYRTSTGQLMIRY